MTGGLRRRLATAYAPPVTGGRTQPPHPHAPNYYSDTLQDQRKPPFCYTVGLSTAPRGTWKRPGRDAWRSDTPNSLRRTPATYSSSEQWRSWSDARGCEKRARSFIACCFNAFWPKKYTLSVSYKLQHELAFFLSLSRLFRDRKGARAIEIKQKQKSVLFRAVTRLKLNTKTTVNLLSSFAYGPRPLLKRFNVFFSCNVRRLK